MLAKLPLLPLLSLDGEKKDLIGSSFWPLPSEWKVGCSRKSQSIKIITIRSKKTAALQW